MKRLVSTRIRDVKRPDNYSLEEDGITQGLIMCFLKCRVEFLLRLNYWGPLEEKKVFANGSITHDTLDKVYTFYNWHKRLPSVLKIRQWITEFDKDKPDWLPKANRGDIPRIKAVCFVVVTEYIRFYKKDFEKWDIIGAEDIFDFKWNGYRLRGKKDLRYRINGEKWIMETKTMARIDEAELVDRISFDFQSHFYTFAEEEDDPSKEQVHGVVYNVVRNPGHKIGKNETLFTYCNRLRREIRKNPKHFFMRWSIPFTKLDKLEFRKELLYILKEIDGWLKGDLSTYRNYKNCVTRFMCTFLRACASGKLVGFARKYAWFKELGEEEIL